MTPRLPVGYRGVLFFDIFTGIGERVFKHEIGPASVIG